MSTSIIIAHGSEPFEDIARFVEESQEDFRVVRTLPGTRVVADVVRRTCPDLLLLGMAAPFTDTLDLLREVKDGLPCKVVVVCTRCDAGWAVEALDAGATAYLFADMEKADVLRILRMISAPPEPPRAVRIAPPEGSNAAGGSAVGTFGRVGPACWQVR